MSENSASPQEPDARIDALIYRWDHVCLKTPGEWVEEFDGALFELAQLMIKIMRQARGVGLAANQIGHEENMFVCNSLDSTTPLVVINPEIVEMELPRKKVKEGCLSIPNIGFDIPRYEQVTILGQNLDGKVFEADAVGFEAQVLQHETDHLNGKLLIDRLSSTESKRAYRYLRKVSVNESLPNW